MPELIESIIVLNPMRKLVVRPTMTKVSVVRFLCLRIFFSVNRLVRPKYGLNKVTTALLSGFRQSAIIQIIPNKISIGANILYTNPEEVVPSRDKIALNAEDGDVLSK